MIFKNHQSYFSSQQDHSPGKQHPSHEQGGRSYVLTQRCSHHSRLCYKQECWCVWSPSEVTGALNPRSWVHQEGSPVHAVRWLRESAWQRNKIERVSSIPSMSIIILVAECVLGVIIITAWNILIISIEMWLMKQIIQCTFMF